MKIGLGVATYYPESIGGTEKYIHELAKYLIIHGVEVYVITPSNTSTSFYIYENYQVHTFKVPKEFSKEELEGNITCRGAENFENVLQKLQLDIFHLHTLSTTLNSFHLEIAKKLGIKTLFTAHIPGTICPKGNLITYSKEVCNGKLSDAKCGYCYAKWRHEDSILGELTGRLAQIPLATQLLASKLPQLKVAKNKQRDLEHLKKSASYIIPTCQWLQDMFLINGFSQEQLRICRQGVELNDSLDLIENKDYETKIKIGFIGRLSPEKGLHNLLNAFLEANLPNVELHLVVIKLSFYDDYDYFDRLNTLINSSDKIYYQENMTSNLIPQFLNSIHALCVPSVCLETGPLVVYEALNQKVPVIGSNIGGIKELVKENENGFLYDFNDIKALKSILTRISQNPNLLKSISKNIKIVRSTKNVGEDMVRIYNSVHF